MSDPRGAGGGGRFGRELLVRLASAAVLLAVAGVFLWLGGWPFAGLAALTAVLILREWIAITGPYDLVMVPWAALVFVGLTVAMAHVDGRQSVAMTLIVVVGLALAALAHRPLAWLAPGLAYAALPCIAAVGLRGGTGDVGLVAMLFVFAVAVATDSAAYFSGRLIGGPKLWPAVSPKKTWSGAVGGATAAVIAGFVVADLAALPDRAAVAVVALVLSIAAQIGDLVESALKRHFHVKDSGVLIPGHGGIMDRVDGLIFALVLAVMIGLINGRGSGIAAGLMMW